MKLLTFMEWLKETGVSFFNDKEAQAYGDYCAREALKRAAQIVTDYVVNLNGYGWPKPLMKDSHGREDAVRYAYAKAIEALLGELE